MKALKLFFVSFIIFTINIICAPWDTGYIEWEQPDRTTFTARSWGDEFAGWMETDNGYQIIIGPDEYYYYAILDENGEFTYSEYKVAIDEPLQDSYQLERSPQRLAEIEAEIEDFKEQVAQNYIDFMAEFDGPSVPPLRLAIVLIDFADDLHSNNYLKKNFDTLFFSTDYYYTIDEHTGPKSPHDNEWVYGSLRDYYKDQSLNKLNIIGKFGSDRSIVNPEDPNNPGKPLWVYMPEEKSDYELLPKGTVMNLAKAEAESQLNLDLDQYDRIGFVYAGVNGVGGTRAASIQYMFTCYERYKATNQPPTFAHIGIPSHEFAHTLGAWDEYEGGDPQDDPQKWSLMAYGVYNGGDNTSNKRNGSCPAHLSPAYRIMFNWVTPVVLETQENIVIQYNYSQPYFYKINILGSSEYFLIERRKKEGFDLFTPRYEYPSNPPKGILIWHIAPDEISNFNLVQLEPADNQYPPDETGVRFPLNDIQDFTYSTTPSSKMRNGDNSFISIENIEWIGNQQTGYAELDYVLEVMEITGTETWSTTRNLAVPVYIKNGGTLNVTNGANINMNGDFIEQVKIVVENGGTLNLSGSENNKVVLLSGDFEYPIRKWVGIEIYGNGILESNYAIIQDVLKPIQVFQNSASCSLNNTEVIGQTGSLLGNIDINNSIFINASFTLSGNIEIENSIFRDAYLRIIQSNNGSRLKKNIFSSEMPNQLYVQLSSTSVSYLEVTNCTFNGINNGLMFGQHGTTGGEDWTDRIKVRNNIFSNCNSSIEINGGTITITYNNFFNNITNENTGSNYKTVDPLYVDPDNGNFNLQWGSGCIDAGNPSSVYNDPDGTRNDIGAKYYDQSPIIPENFTVTTGPNDHPLLEWEGAPHLSYKVYALYEYYNGNSSNNEYTTLSESYLDQTVIIIEPNGHSPNQVVAYSVTSINSIDEESEHTEEISIDAFGRISKEAFVDSNFIPVSYNLFNPYPNPFNPSTTVVFDLPEKSFVSVKLFSITGEEVRTIVNEQMDAGRRYFLIDGNGLSSGVYLLRMISNDFVNTKKIIMMK